MEKILLQIGENVSRAFSDKYANFAEFTPYILGAVAVFLFGWILAELAAHGIIGLADGLKLEVISDKIGLRNFLKRIHVKITPSEAIASGVKGYLIFLFFIEATRIAKLTKVADFLTEVLDYIPDVIIALFIVMVGIRVGNTMQLLISTSLSFAKDATAQILGVVAKSTVVTFAALAALSQLQIAPILVQVMFIGFIAMLALAGGLAFGLGGKDVVKEVLEAIKKIELKQSRKR